MELLYNINTLFAECNLVVEAIEATHFGPVDYFVADVLY